ncbi:flavin-containing monooxygenase [Litchfieldia alkalitelluris]|uniref:flavin-containing monooxygenase n=1 Tax=Litchfieldia alkalitelluris TaxID=304268 RepID=UPI000998933E|nr:NAD(P)/FAD-dependent oxidoreductase [Litchfieldia alkalitelluris]
MTISHEGNPNEYVDAVVIGAGFSGLYMLHRLREAGFSTKVYEAADGVGGTWYWNRYPGARCDSESIYYNYTFSEELYREWTWSSRYPEQPEILKYLNFVADKLELRPDIQFNTRVLGAHYDEETKRWNIELNDGNTVSAKYFITGVGCLSASNIPNFKGLDQFKGDWYHTGHWPHEKVDFSGKRVGIVGTGSSGVQAIPVIAAEAAHVTVFQRTPQYSAPARNHPYDLEYIEKAKENFHEIKKQMRESIGGQPMVPPTKSALEVSQEERNQKYDEAWQNGGLGIFTAYYDITVTEEANETAAEYIRSKIKETVHNPDVAQKLLPSYYYGTKRPIIDTNYYETYNRENVSLVDVKSQPIVEITEKGVKTTEDEYELDVLVFATGFDGMTGPLLKLDIRGKGGVSLKEKWQGGEQTRTYLGVANAGFPNFFMITGPESPSVLSNMPVSIEQHVEWIGDCIDYMKEKGYETIEANVEAEEEWSKHCREVAEATLFTKTESWYMGANIPNKPRRFLIYLGGVGVYRQKCDEIAKKGYEGFSFEHTSASVIQ